MALKMARLFGGEPRAAENTDFDVPTTQVRMGITSPEGYDTPPTLSVMEQLRTASNAPATRPKLGLIGNLPVVKQFQILGVLTVAFLALAAFMVYLDNRAANQQSTQSSIALGRTPDSGGTTPTEPSRRSGPPRRRAAT